jgi:hypothetical protein
MSECMLLHINFNFIDDVLINEWNNSHVSKISSILCVHVISKNIKLSYQNTQTNAVEMTVDDSTMPKKIIMQYF